MIEEALRTSLLCRNEPRKRRRNVRLPTVAIGGVARHVRRVLACRGHHRSEELADVDLYDVRRYAVHGDKDVDKPSSDQRTIEQDVELI